MSTGPHADAIARTLEAMRARYAELPRALTPADRHSREITLALHEAVMPLFGKARDANGSIASDEAFAQGFTHAIGNLLASMANSFLPAGYEPAEEQELMVQQTTMLMRAAGHRALLRAMDPSREMVVWVVPSPSEGDGQ